MRSARAVQGREVFQKWTLRAQASPYVQSASAFGGFTGYRIEHGVAVLVLGQVDRQNPGQGGDEVVDLVDVVNAADANGPGGGVCQHHGLIQVAVDQRQCIGQRQVVEHQ